MRAEEGDNLGALADYDHALGIDPKDAEALRGRGFVHLQRREAAAALSDLEGALALNPNDTLAQRFRASARTLLSKQTH